MWYYVTKRILATLPVMGVVAVIVFLLLRLSPGDPAAIIAGALDCRARSVELGDLLSKDGE